MKKSILIAIFWTILLLSCGGNDDSVQPVNSPPGSFSLLSVSDNAVDVDRMPLLSWEAAIDPDGDEVTYSLYLQKASEGNQLVAENLAATEYQLTTLLSLIQEYTWYVVAKDTGGEQRTSSTFTFVTRNLSSGQMANPAAGFSPRLFHTTFTFSDRLFLLGGLDIVNSTEFGDIWSSEDGSLWVNETNNASFSSGYLYSIIQIENELFLLCGRDLYTGFFDEVWKSSDGVQWSQILSNVAFGERLSPCTAFENKLWIAGGINSNGDNLNDTWVSNNGSDWTVATSNAAFNARQAHQFLSFKNKLWIIGGFSISTGVFLNDVWSSSDGINWIQETSSAEFSPRYDHKVVQYDDKIWLFGGLDSSGIVSDVWYSNDGVQWFLAIQDSPAMAARSSFELSVFKDKFWLTAGYKNGSVKNDVWVFE